MGGNDHGLNSATILAYYVECKAEKVGVKSNSSPIRNLHKNEVTDAVIELCEDFENRYAKSFGEMCKECASKNLTPEGYWGTLSELLDKNLNWGRIDRLSDRNFHKNKVTDAVVELCEEFEDRNAKSFGKFCKVCASDNLTQEGYWCILSNVLGTDLSWGNIIFIFAFAGALSVDRMRSNCHGDVENIQDWTCKFMRKHVEHWVEKNNGWNGLVEFHNKPDEKQNGGWGSLFVSAFSAACLRVIFPNHC